MKSIIIAALVLTLATPAFAQVPNTSNEATPTLKPIPGPVTKDSADAEPYTPPQEEENNDRRSSSGGRSGQRRDTHRAELIRQLDLLTELVRLLTVLRDLKAIEASRLVTPVAPVIEAPIYFKG